jgi:benzoylformate decarboxylase
VAQACADRRGRRGSLGPLSTSVTTTTVREATFDVFRRRGLTTLFSNPGSTEVPFLTDLPRDIEFVLGLHEGPVVAMATGYALGGGAASLALLHTTAGLGNAVGAIATARVNRAPVVIVVGQQDRRHLVFEPFLTGRLEKLAGDYPVWVDAPVRAGDVPGAIARAAHEAETHRGPALVIVPMDDWSASADDDREDAAPDRIVRAAGVDAGAVDELTRELADAEAPAIVVGAGADDEDAWSALKQIAERLLAPVFQESFGSRAGFPQDHRLFGGFLPADRPRLREKLAPYDVVLVVGAPVFRQSPYASGRFTEDSTRILVLGEHADEVHRSPAHLAVLGPLAATCREVAQRIPQREAEPPEQFRPPPEPAPAPPMLAGHVLAALAERLPPDATVVEEAPVDRPELHERLPARRPLGFLSAAMGGLGFALGGATGLRMAQPERPVVAVVGDGSSLYGIQALWSAAHYKVGVLFVILSNGGYAIMDRLAERTGGDAPWPQFADVDVAALARAFGCDARKIGTHDELLAALDEVVPDLAARGEPLLLDVAIAPTATFAP